MGRSCQARLTRPHSILEYPTMGEAETAVARLRELEIRGAKPQVDIDDVGRFVPSTSSAPDTSLAGPAAATARLSRRLPWWWRRLPPWPAASA